LPARLEERPAQGLPRILARGPRPRPLRRLREEMSVPWGFGSLDRVAFGLINRTWTHPTLDALMSGVTDLNRAPWFRYGVAPASIALWLYKGRKQALRV